MTLSGDGTPTEDAPHGSRAARWSLVLGLATAASIAGVVAAISAPRWVELILVAVAAAGGLGSMVLGVVSFVPRRNISNRARRQAFAGATLGSLVLVGIGLSAASAFASASEANRALTRSPASSRRPSRRSSGASTPPAGPVPRPRRPSNNAHRVVDVLQRYCSVSTGTFLCAATFSNSTSVPSGTALVLLAWAGLVFAAGWLVFGGPPSPSVDRRHHPESRQRFREETVVMAARHLVDGGAGPSVVGLHRHQVLAAAVEGAVGDAPTARHPGPSPLVGPRG